MDYQDETLHDTSLEPNVSSDGLQYNEMLKYKMLSYRFCQLWHSFNQKDLTSQLHYLQFIFDLGWLRAIFKEAIPLNLLFILAFN